MPEKVYGPYLRKDGRKHVVRIHFDDDGRELSRRTQSYPRYLIESSSDSSIPTNLTVDHVNRDKTDDNLSNFRLLPLKEHLQDDAVYRKNSVGICASCQRSFELTRHQTSERARSKPGPFCSRSCASRKTSREGKPSVCRPEPTYYQRVK